MTFLQTAEEAMDKAAVIFPKALSTLTCIVLKNFLDESIAQVEETLIDRVCTGIPCGVYFPAGFSFYTYSRNCRTCSDYRYVLLYAVVWVYH